MSDFLEEKRQEISDRLKELKPVVDEYSRLEAAAGALAAAVGDLIGTAASEVSAAASAAVSRRRGRGRPRSAGASKKGPGRPRGSGKRARKATQTSTPAASTPATVERKKPGRPKGSGKKPGRPAGKVGRPKAGGGGRPKGAGKRAVEALSLVQGQPGITIPELAAKMGIKQNYLYRVLPGLEKEGKLEKKGRGWHPKS